MPDAVNRLAEIGTCTGRTPIFTCVILVVSVSELSKIAAASTYANAIRRCDGEIEYIDDATGRTAFGFWRVGEADNAGIA